MSDEQGRFKFSDPPRARRTDPLSSHVAADKVRPFLSRQRRPVWEAMQKHPGRTTKDLAAVSGLDRYMVARRMPELANHGYAERVDRDGKETLWFPLQGESA